MTNTQVAGVIRAAGLTKLYGRTLGVRDVSFDVKAGEVVGLLGPNGAGKTTTIRLLLSLVRPTRGECWLFGSRAWASHSFLHSAIGYLPGELGLYQYMSGERLLAYLGSFYPQGCPRREELLARLEVGSENLRRPIKHYSTGMKRKIGFVQALQHDPQLLILDEPTKGLDPLMQHVVHELLAVEAGRGKTILLSTHVLSEAEKVCSRVCLMRAGELLADEPIASLKARRVRRLSVTFETCEAAEQAHLPGTTLENRTENRAVYIFTGDIKELVSALVHAGMCDFSLPEPDLEDVFLELYRDERDRK